MVRFFRVRYNGQHSRNTIHSRIFGEDGVFLASLATYGAGLVVRPFGAIFFGRMGGAKCKKTIFT